MTIETYYNFIKIIECGNIAQASNELYIAQPALSTQLKNLEKNLGVKLVDRSPKGVTLTAAGKLFYDKAKIICSLDTQMKNEINSYSSGVSGCLDISLPESSPYSLFYSLFEGFVKNHKDISFRLNEVCESDAIDNVKNGLSEIGIIRSDIRQIDGLKVVPYKKEEFLAVVPKNSPLAKYDEIYMEQLNSVSLAVPANLKKLIDDAFEHKGLKPTYRLISTSRRISYYFMNVFEDSVCILPYSKNDQMSDDRCKTVKIKDSEISSYISVIIRKDANLSPAAQAFLKSIGIII